MLYSAVDFHFETAACYKVHSYVDPVINRQPTHFLAPSLKTQKQHSFKNNPYTLALYLNIDIHSKTLVLEFVFKSICVSNTTAKNDVQFISVLAHLWLYHEFHQKVLYECKFSSRTHKQRTHIQFSFGMIFNPLPFVLFCILMYTSSFAISVPVCLSFYLRQKKLHFKVLFLNGDELNNSD